VVSVDPTLTAIDESHFQHVDVKGKAVLIHTGWDRYWNTDDYLENHPYLTESAAAYLVSQQPALVGIDSMNIDNTKGKARPAHTLLLGADIVIAEHLCHLDQLTEPFLFYAVPPKIKGAGTFPVRAFAEVERK
jgi:kynurenine formamidase